MSIPDTDRVIDIQASDSDLEVVRPEKDKIQEVSKDRSLFSSEVLPRRAREILKPAQELAITSLKESQDRIARLEQIMDGFQAEQLESFIAQGFQSDERHLGAELVNRKYTERIQSTVDTYLKLCQKIGKGQDVREFFTDNENDFTFSQREFDRLHEGAFGSGKLSRLVPQFFRGEEGRQKRNKFFEYAKNNGARRLELQLTSLMYEQKPLEEKVYEIGSKIKSLYDGEFSATTNDIRQVKADLGEYHALVTGFDTEIALIDSLITKVKTATGDSDDRSIDSLLSLRRNLLARKERVQQNEQNWARSLSSLPEVWCRKTATKVDDLLRSSQKALSSLEKPSEDNFSSVMPNPWMTQEFQNEVLKTVEVATAFLKKNPDLSQFMVSLADSLKSLSGNLEYVRQKNKEFASSELVLTHGTSYDVVKRILTTGFLASRAAQLEMFGEATFATALITKMTPDRVTVQTSSGLEEMSWDEYERRHKTIGSNFKKSIHQESHQLCFARGGADWRFNDGAVFIFNEKHLLNKKKFMTSDGVHVFDEAYKTGLRSSPGFSVELAKEPFVIIVEDDKKNDFLQTVEQVVKNLNDTGTPITVEQWLSEHVVFAQKAGGADVIELAKAKLRTQDIEIDEGVFYPTGERGENATGNQKLLFSYDSTARLQESVKQEVIQLSAEKIHRLAESRELNLNAFLDAFQEDPDIGEQYVRDAGVFERITLREHTTMVLKQFEKYFSGELSDFARVFMRIFLALHDIGKAEAVTLHGSTEFQHEVTKPMMMKAYDKLGFPDQVKEFAEVLMDQDFLGNYFKRMEPPQEVATKIANAAKKIGMSVEYFYDVVKMFYMVDAGSYTKDAGGMESLDFLFDFDAENGKIEFSSKESGRLSYRSPKDHITALDVQVKLLAA